MYLKRKYQVGGIAYTPYLPAQAGSPQESASSGGTSSSSSPEKISGTVKKEIIDLLKENGIPSDVSKFLNVANKFLNKSTSLSQFSLFGGSDDDYDMSDLIKIQQLVNDVKFNKGLQDEAIKQVTKEAAGSEIAITDSGQLYVQDKDGNIKQISASTYAKDKDNYAALTNNQLLYLRQQDPNMAFNTSILNDLQNTIGMSTITKQLRDIITSFGSDKVEGYATKDKAINRGMQLLMENGPDGYYQFTSEEELRDVNRALRYLYNSMSNNAKNLLQAKTAVEGGDPSDPNDVSNLLLQALYEHTSNTTSVKFDKTATEYDLARKSGTTSSESLTKDTYPERLVTGDGLDPAQWINIMPQNTGVTLHAYSQNAGPILRDKEDRMSTTNLQVVLTKAYGVTGIVDAQSITFGDQLINPSDYREIMCDSYTNMKRVYLPIKYETDGRITPNFEAQQKLEQVQSFIADQNGQVSDAWITNWLNENLPEARWDSETKQVVFDNRYVRPFLVLHGIAARNLVDFDTNSEYLHHLSRDEGREWKDDYDRIITEENVVDKFEHNKAKSTSPRKYYSGNIYLPISGPTVGSFIYNDQFFTKDVYTDITQKATANQTRQQMKTNF